MLYSIYLHSAILIYHNLIILIAFSRAAMSNSLKIPLVFSLSAFPLCIDFISLCQDDRRLDLTSLSMMGHQNDTLINRHLLNLQENVNLNATNTSF